MTSKFIKIGLLLIIVLVMSLVMIYLKLGALISFDLSRKLGVDVAIEEILLRPTRIEIKNMQINNPTGYQELPFALKVNAISLQTPLSNFFKKQIMINEIALTNIELGLIFDSISNTDGNWTKIISNILSYTAAMQNKELEERSVEIRTIALKNIDTQVFYKEPLEGPIVLPNIDVMEFYDIKSNGSLPINQIANSVLVKMLESVFIKQNLKNMLNNVITLPVKPLEYLLFPFTELFRKKVEEPPENPTPLEPLKKVEGNE